MLKGLVGSKNLTQEDMEPVGQDEGSPHRYDITLAPWHLIQNTFCLHFVYKIITEFSHGKPGENCNMVFSRPGKFMEIKFYYIWCIYTFF